MKRCRLQLVTNTALFPTSSSGERSILMDEVNWEPFKFFFVQCQEEA